MTGRPREAGGKDSKKLRTAVDSMTAFRGNELGTGIYRVPLAFDARLILAGYDLRVHF